LKVPIQDSDTQTSEDQAENGSVIGQDVPGEQIERKSGKLEKKELPKKKKDEISELKSIINNLTEELEKRESELVVAEGKALRAIADSENYSKRLAREYNEKSRFAALSLIESVLPALDNLEKASQAVEEGSGSLDQLCEGVRMTHQQFVDILGKQGLEKLDVVGKPFDPTLCEAVHVEQTNDSEDGTVIRELAPGYSFKGRIIRAAKVCVARNNPSEPET